VSRAMCRTSGAALGLAKGTFPAQGFSFPQPPDDTKRPLRRRERGMLKEATILDKIDGKFIPHLSSKMVRFSFRAASSLNSFWGVGGMFAIPFSSFCCPRLDARNVPSGEERGETDVSAGYGPKCATTFGIRVFPDRWSDMDSIHTMNDLIFSFEKKLSLAFL